MPRPVSLDKFATKKELEKLAKNLLKEIKLIHKILEKKDKKPVVKIKKDKE